MHMYNQSAASTQLDMFEDLSLRLPIGIILRSQDTGFLALECKLWPCSPCMTDIVALEVQQYKNILWHF